MAWYSFALKRKEIPSYDFFPCCETMTRFIQASGDTRIKAVIYLKKSWSQNWRCLKVSVILGITEIIFSPLGLGRSSHPVVQGLPYICSHVEVMGFWQLFSRVFSFLKPCWCDNINQHFCGNSAFGDEHCNQDEEPLMSIAEIKESKFSKIAFTGKMHFDPKPLLSTSSMLAWQSQGCSQSEGLAPLWIPSRDGPHPSRFPVLLSSVCQCCPSYAAIWPDSLASLAPGR